MIPALTRGMCHPKSGAGADGHCILRLPAVQLGAGQEHRASYRLPARLQNLRSLLKAPCQPWYQIAPVEAFTDSIPAVLPLRVTSIVK